VSWTRRKPGRMGPHVDGFHAWLLERGYTPGTVLRLHHAEPDYCYHRQTDGSRGSPRRGAVPRTRAPPRTA
jgi:hypothetical protein